MRERLYQISNRGISTVLGVAVLVGVVVLLAAVVGSFVFGITDINRDTAFAGVTVSQTGESTVEVRVDSMGEAEALLVETAGGQQVVTSPGVYEYDSFGREVRVIGSSGQTTQLLRAFEPDVDSTQTADVLTVESDQTVQTADGSQTFETLAAAKQAAESGDVIRFESGVHLQPETVNETVTTPVKIVAEPNTVFSCDQTQVNLRLQNATMSQRSAFIQTNQCGFQPVTVPAPEGSGGSVDVLAGGTDTSSSNQQRGDELDTAAFSSTSSLATAEGSSQPTATTDTSVTVRVSSTSNYESLTVKTQAGSRTLTQPGVYTVETYGYNATVSGTTVRGETVKLDTIITEEQQPETTTETTRDGEPVNKTESQPVDTYLVEADDSNTVASETSDSVKRVGTLSQADTQASQGDLIKLESGVHSDPDTVTASLSTNVTLAIGPETELSCEQTKISLSIGEASLSDQSPFPDVFCDGFDDVSTSTVTETLNSSGANIPSTVSLSDTISYDNGGTEVIEDVATDDKGNVYVAGFSRTSDESNYHVVKYSQNGEILWQQREKLGRYSHASAVTVDSNGNVYVTGDSDLKDPDRIYTVKYDSAGNTIWSRFHEASGGFDGSEGNDIFIDQQKNVYVSAYDVGAGGNAHVFKFNSTGGLEWEVSGGQAKSFGVSKHQSGSIYTAGTSDIHKHDAETGAFSTFSSIRGEDVVRDSEGNILVAGPTSNGEAYALKIGAENNQLWKQTTSTPNQTFSKSAATDPNGNVYIAGGNEASDGQRNIYIAKYSSSGEQQWTKEVDFNGSQFASSISVDKNGVVYVGATEDNDYTILKFSG